MTSLSVLYILPFLCFKVLFLENTIVIEICFFLELRHCNISFILINELSSVDILYERRNHIDR